MLFSHGYWFYGRQQRNDRSDAGALLVSAYVPETAELQCLGPQVPIESPILGLSAHMYGNTPDIGPLAGILYNFTPLVNGAGLAIYGSVRT